jgi:hypothetical protein
VGRHFLGGRLCVLREAAWAVVWFWWTLAFCPCIYRQMSKKTAQTAKIKRKVTANGKSKLKVASNGKIIIDYSPLSPSDLG